MHLEFLVEGAADRAALEPLLATILGPHGRHHTWSIRPHKGVGRLPDVLTARPNRRNQSLMHNLPAKLRAYGRSLTRDQAVVILADLDDKDPAAFERAMQRVLKSCKPAPKCLFRLAVEETEAWFLGDRKALLRAFPKAKKAVLDGYEQDSICGTWEVLADAVYPGGIRALSRRGHRAKGRQKHLWAEKIAPCMALDRNASASFNAFVAGIEGLVGKT